MPKTLITALTGLFFTATMLGGCSSSNTSAFATAGVQAAPVERKDGWIMLRLSGSPYEIGHAHGSALAAEIDDAIRENILAEEHTDGDDPAMTWAWARQACQEVIEPKLPADIRAELQGIADGVHEHGFSYDFTDVVTYNAILDLEYYLPVWRKAHGQKTAFAAPQRCSAFIATGSATADGRIVAAHNTWSSYRDGARTNVILDITPQKGHRFVMDALPGFIHSSTDWFINDAGIIITETTIGDYEGFEANGVPEFVRARQAAQFSTSIDDAYRWLIKNSNGAYANTWLIGDINTNEIAKLELGLKNAILHRSTDGAYFGSNFPEDSKLIAEECLEFKYDATDGTEVRRARWAAVLAEHKGKVEAQTAKAFMADTVDARSGAMGATTCTLCGRGDLTPDSKGEYGSHGAVNAKVTTAALAKDLRFWARMGFPDGSSFDAKAYLASVGKKDEWQRSVLKDIPSHPWMLYAGR
jgi:hypothetical protein